MGAYASRYAGSSPRALQMCRPLEFDFLREPGRSRRARGRATKAPVFGEWIGLDAWRLAGQRGGQDLDAGSLQGLSDPGSVGGKNPVTRLAQPRQDKRSTAVPQYRNRPPLDPETPLWRYLNLEAVVATLRDRKLRFTRDDTFVDPFEGSVPRQEIDNQLLLFSGAQQAQMEVMQVAAHYPGMGVPAQWREDKWERMTRYRRAKTRAAHATAGQSVLILKCAMVLRRACPERASPYALPSGGSRLRWLSMTYT